MELVNIEKELKNFGCNTFRFDKIGEVSFHQHFGDKETFAKDKASLSTLAMLLDGKWYEQGKMGWFGMSDTTSDSLKEYTKFFNKTLEELKQTHPYATVTLVDCHI